MSKKLYVGGLPWATTEDELRELFSQFGKVISVFIPTDKFSGKSRGFAFVEMSTEEEAQKAIDNLDQSQLGERTIVVNEARPQTDRPRSQKSGNQRDFRSRKRY